MVNDNIDIKWKYYAFNGGYVAMRVAKATHWYRVTCWFSFLTKLHFIETLWPSITWLGNSIPWEIEKLVNIVDIFNSFQFQNYKMIHQLGAVWRCKIQHLFFLQWITIHNTHHIIWYRTCQHFVLIVKHVVQNLPWSNSQWLERVWQILTKSSGRF